MSNRPFVSEVSSRVEARQQHEFEEAFGAAVPHVLRGELSKPEGIAFLSRMAMLLFQVDDRAAFLAYAENRFERLGVAAARSYGVSAAKYELWRLAWPAPAALPVNLWRASRTPSQPKPA